MKIGLIHSTRLVIPWIERAAAPLLPRTTFLHSLDEALIVELAKGEGVTEGAARRILWLAESLIDVGAERLILTCSSLSPAVDDIAPKLKVPFVKVDAAMVRSAVSEGRPFVVLATNPSTRTPLRLIVENESAGLAKAQKWEYRLLDGAFAALNRGDPARHDAEVVAACESIAASRCLGPESAPSRILFAQISMARVIPKLSPNARSLVSTSLDFLAETASAH